MKIKYIISSHKLYYDITVRKLVNSLLASGISKRDIFVVVGGEAHNNPWYMNDIEYKSVTTNSFDWTSLIEVMKHDMFPDYEYLFLLHDTCEVGVNFKAKVEGHIKPYTVTLAMFGAHPASNIGLYQRKALYENADMRESIITKENMDKSFYVQWEDLYFFNKSECYFSPNVKVLGYEKVYSDSTVREINYCEAIELYKYKANWYVRDWVIAP